MAFISPTINYTRSKRTAEGVQTPSTKVLGFVLATGGDYTDTIDLTGAKSVWISKSLTGVALEYYMPSYYSADDTSDPPLYSAGDVRLAGPDTAYIKMTTDAVNVVLPSALTAAAISESHMPPYLSIKNAGSTANQVVLVRVTY